MNDVKITVIANKGCPRMNVGDFIVVKGDKVHAPLKQGMCFYSLSALAPVLAPLEMPSDSNDHYILKFSKFNCPMGQVVYKAERHDNIDLEELEHFSANKDLGEKQ